MRSRRSTREDLRRAVDCLPRRTQVAMLEGIRANDIIVGAYVDRKGGVCPMLAAHRCGGRTDFLSFAYAWDHFTHAKRPRRATEREISVLVSYLQAALLHDDLTAHSDLRGAIAEHQSAARARRAREATDLGIRLEDIAREEEAALPAREPELLV
jgi:hypothetical protein